MNYIDENKNNSRTMVFIRHGKVDLPYNSHDDMPFDVLNKLATQELDPNSDEVYFNSNKDYFRKLMVEHNFTHIYYSSSNRCISLANYLKNVPGYNGVLFVRTPLIKEIKFNLDIMSVDHGIRLSDIRFKLFQGLLGNSSGVEDLLEVTNRLNLFYKSIPDSGNILILTHGFLMMLIAATHSIKQLTEESIKLVPRFGYFNGFILKKNKIYSFLTDE